MQHDRGTSVLQNDDEAVTAASPAEIQSVDASAQYEDTDPSLTSQFLDMVVRPGEPMTQILNLMKCDQDE